ncbi:hypothetical protein GBF38_020176, partial [Nibea albiflora]
RSPKNPQQKIIKRVIGLEGDFIRFRECESHCDETLKETFKLSDSRSCPANHRGRCLMDRREDVSWDDVTSLNHIYVVSD